MPMKKIFIAGTVTLLFLGASCFQSQPQDAALFSSSLNNAMTADEIATVLLNESDVQDIITGVRPRLIEFNDHLDDLTDTTTDYFVSRKWADASTGTPVMSTVISNYVDATTAQEQIIVLAGENEPLTTTSVIGDNQIVYNDGDLVTYRFAMGEYGVRVTAPSLEEAVSLAQRQADLLSQIGHQSTIILPYNNAITHLPATVSGGKLLGTTSVSALEWLTATNDLDSQGIEGFVSGGLRRWQITDRPEEVVEVTVIETNSAAEADTMTQILKEAITSDSAIELPNTITSKAAAISYDTVFETQGSVGNYFIDVIIFSPFGEVNASAAMADLTKISEDIILNFEK